MPSSTCLATTSTTARFSVASYATGSTASPLSLATIASINSAGRGRLPTWVVIIRSVLRFMSRFLDMV